MFFFAIQEADIDKAKDVDAVQAENAVDVTSATDAGSETSKVDANGPSSVVAQAVAQTRQEMPGILEVLKAGKFQVRWILGGFGFMTFTYVNHVITHCVGIDNLPLSFFN